LWATYENKEVMMGGRFEWMDKCPNCGSSIRCYYAESSGITEVKCSFCKKRYEIIMDFKFKEIQGDKK